MKKKRCSKCKHQLPASLKFFAKDVSKKSGLTSYCRMCKRIRDRARNRARQKWFQDIKKHSKCERCGESRWYVLDFHHKEGVQKKADVCKMVSGSKMYSKKEIIAEMAKCTILCANCHREVHFLEAVDMGGHSLTIEVIK